MDLLERGGTYVCRKLLGGHEKRKLDTRHDASDSEDEGTDVMPRSQLKQVERHQCPNQLYAPRTSNYIGIDAWIPNFGGFQMTVEESTTPSLERQMIWRNWVRMGIASFL
ncbi:hypothetical protein PsorP6_005846 [Peronosclerospora sorghi]|uniref:Uncharacterized protein n=1 Tax=Peronosclerospora sorghi TaxID=230839 RepID=A0ACC0W466_9STRA|nr:hypothetical protein PsorP6_005846 [Peronosclerospora sorghi]